MDCVPTECKNKVFWILILISDYCAWTSTMYPINSRENPTHVSVFASLAEHTQYTVSCHVTNTSAESCFRCRRLSAQFSLERCCTWVPGPLRESVPVGTTANGDSHIHTHTSSEEDLLVCSWPLRLYCHSSFLQNRSQNCKELLSCRWFLHLWVVSSPPTSM